MLIRSLMALLLSLVLSTAWAAPILTTNAASGLTASGATLNGNVNSNGAGAISSIAFDYGPTAGYGSNMAATPGSLASGSAAVSAAVTGLTCNTLYHYRVRGTYIVWFFFIPTVTDTYGGDATFTTSACPPTATTNAASGLSASGATLNGTVSSNGLSTTVAFNYGQTTGYGSTVAATPSPLAAGATNAAVSATMAGLTCNTVYHYRVSGTSSAGTTNGGDATFTTSACAPTVTTNAASGLSAGGATLNGTVSSKGASTTVTFDYGLTASYGSTATASGSPLAAGATNAGVSFAASGLTCNTLYHYRVNGTNSAGTANGGDTTFTTAACIPSTVTTNPATGLSANGATLNGTVSSNGTSTTVTFDYGLTTGYGSTATATQSPLAASATNAAVSAVVTGLTCNTLYHYRVKGVNSVGTTNGLDATFTTAACAATVTTTAATGLSATGATLNGTVSSNGASTAVSFDYGPTLSYGTNVAATPSPLAASATNAAVSAVVTGLTCNTTYHYRVNATNSGGTTNGNDVTFTTSACVVTLGMTASTTAAPINSYASFSITATNNNSSNLSNVVITDALPTGMTYWANAATLPTVSVAGNTITWTILNLPAGDTETLTVVVKLTKKGYITNTVTSPGATSVSATILVLPSAVTHYQMDEPVGSWTGSPNDAIDTGGNGLNGHRRTTATPTKTNTVAPGFTTPTSDTIASEYPAVVGGGFCNAGYFDGNSVIETPSSPFFGFTKTLSASAWIFPFAWPSGSSDLYSILSNDTNYEFHITPSGHLYWWWQASTLTSAKTIPVNQWTHIAITMDATIGRELIYINGVPDTNTNNWKGTLAQNACPFYVGGDIYTTSPQTTPPTCTLASVRNFHGMIDEAKIYDYELSAADVNADMTLGRLCTGAFDHIEIDHDGEASVCVPKIVTLKACLDAKCTALYPGPVTVNLSPTGNTVTINGGLSSASLTGITPTGTPPNTGITLGAVATSPSANNPTRCFNSAKSTWDCFVHVVPTTSCDFDAYEDGIAPNRIYTKLVRTQFPLDMVRYKPGTTIPDILFTGQVDYDLIDTSSIEGCSLAALGLNQQQSYTYKLADAGVTKIKLACCSPPSASPACSSLAPANCTTTSKNVFVRMILHGTPTVGCSTDGFAVRPSAVTLTPDAGPIKAGGPFNIGATTNPTAGYNEVLTLDMSPPPHSPPGPLRLDVSLLPSPQNNSTLGTLTLVNPSLFQANPPPPPPATNGATYSEVGSFYANPGAFVDKTYTGVDQGNNPNRPLNQNQNQPAGCAATATCTSGCATDNSCDCWMPVSNPADPNYLNYLSDTLIGGRYGCFVGNQASFKFGPFVPDHFDTAVTPTPNCPGFFYSGQPMTIQVTAMNGLLPTSTPTVNYDSALGFSKTVTLIDSNGIGVFFLNTIDKGAFAAGVANGNPKFTFVPAPHAPAFMLLHAIDADTTPAIGKVTEGSANIISGRLRLIAGQGSELAPFWMQTEVQSFGGTYWSTNVGDNCTTYTAANFGVSGPPGTTVSDVKPIKNGFGSILVTAPSPISRGFANICLNMSGTPAKNCVLYPNTPSAASPDLGYLRTSTGLDPFAIIDFGGANSNSRGNWGYIYRRENF